jgi:hypothetical protein
VNARLTRKQRAILECVLKAADAGNFYNIRELHATLPYENHYGSFRCSIKFLEKHRLIEKEPAGRSSLIKPTSLAYVWLRRAGA